MEKSKRELMGELHSLMTTSDHLEWWEVERMVDEIFRQWPVTEPSSATLLYEEYNRKAKEDLSG